MFGGRAGWHPAPSAEFEFVVPGNVLAREARIERRTLATRNLDDGECIVMCDDGAERSERALLAGVRKHLQDACHLDLPGNDCGSKGNPRAVGHQPGHATLLRSAMGDVLL